MTRKLTCILLTSAGALLTLSACSGTDKPLETNQLISSCDNNTVTTGGYIWTFLDAGEGEYGTVSPQSVWDEESQSGTPYATAASPDPEDATNQACAITGTRSAAAVPDVPDTCGDIPLYPVSGLGFSFLDKNALFSICNQLGIRFRAKGTVTTGGITPATMSVMVNFPTAETDKWQVGDKWDQALETCTCQGDLPAPDPAVPEPPRKTCFGFWGKTISVTPEWQYFTVLWGELSQPTAWAGIVPFIPEHVLKTQFDMPTGDSYTFEVDDIQFVLPDDKSYNWCAAKLDRESINPAHESNVLCTQIATKDPVCNTAVQPLHF